MRSPTLPVRVPATLQADYRAEPRTAEDEDSQAASFIARQGARQLALITVVDIIIFFAVLMVGFAYVWMRGDLNWVRAVRPEQARADVGSGGGDEPRREPVLSA